MPSPTMTHYYHLLLQIASKRFPDLVEEMELHRGLTFNPLSFRKEKNSTININGLEQENFSKMPFPKKPIF